MLNHVLLEIRGLEGGILLIFQHIIVAPKDTLNHKIMPGQPLVAKLGLNGILLQKVLPLHKPSRFHRSESVRSLVAWLLSHMLLPCLPVINSTLALSC